MVSELHRSAGITIILVSHSMEDVAMYVERVIVMDKGRVAYDDVPREVFSHSEELEKMGLAIPEPSKIARQLIKAGLNVDPGVLTSEEAADSIYKALMYR